MKLITRLFIISLFLTITPSFTSAASCKCTTYSTGVAKACEQKSESDCYAQLNPDNGCVFYTDDACKNDSTPLAPGLAWTGPECATAKGDWIPPDTEIKNGPYCYEDQDFVKPYTLSVDILGANKTGISNLGQYISLVYKLVIGLAIFFAIIMTTIAGFMWLTAGGNSSKISEAKKKILNALIGLLLAVGAYTILQTINPRLLELHLPLIPKIKVLNYAGITDCGGYKHMGDCQKNPVGFNSGIAVYAPAGYSGVGCAWVGDATTGSCVQKEFKGSGYLGGLCLADEKCNGDLKCVFTAGIHVCTDGNINSVCGTGPTNLGCQEGLTCDDILASICYKKGFAQPQGTRCDDDKVCAGGICEDRRCRIGPCDPTKCPIAGQVCLKNNTQKIETCQNPVKCGTHEACQQTYGETYYCPNKFYDQYKNTLDTKYIESYYGLKNSATAMKCTAGYPGNTICRFNQECINKKCTGVDDTASPLKPGKCN